MKLKFSFLAIFLLTVHLGFCDYLTVSRVSNIKADPTKDGEVHLPHKLVEEKSVVVYHQGFGVGGLAGWLRRGEWKDNEYRLVVG